jgi:hypothetical protein
MRGLADYKGCDGMRIEKPRHQCEWCEKKATYQLRPRAGRYNEYERHACGEHLPKTLRTVELDLGPVTVDAWHKIDGFVLK